MTSKKKLEQRKEFREYLSIADKRVLDIKKSGIDMPYLFVKSSVALNFT